MRTAWLWGEQWLVCTGGQYLKFKIMRMEPSWGRTRGVRSSHRNAITCTNARRDVRMDSPDESEKEQTQLLALVTFWLKRSRVSVADGELEGNRRALRLIAVGNSIEMQLPETRHHLERKVKYKLPSHFYFVENESYCKQRAWNQSKLVEQA